jgi:hypothetical protein
MRRRIQALWIDIKAWLIATRSAPPLAYFALIPIVAASVFGSETNQSLLATFNPLANSAEVVVSAATAPVRQHWQSLNAYIGSVIGLPQERQSEIASFADMRLRSTRMPPFDEPGPAGPIADARVIDTDPTGSLAADPLPARRAAEGLIDWALHFDPNGYVSEKLARRALDLWPDSQRAKLMLGRILADRDDENGIAMLMEVANHDPRAVAPVRPFIESYAAHHQSSAYAQRMQEIIREWTSVADLAIGERRRTTGGQFLPIDLDSPSIDQIRTCVEASPAGAAAQLIHIPVVRWVDLPAYVIVVDDPSDPQGAALAACIDMLQLDATIAVESAPAIARATLKSYSLVLYWRKI